MANKFTALQNDVKMNKQFLNQTQWSWLINWVNPYTQDYTGSLVQWGELEHFFLARRFLARFPEALNITYTPKKFVIQTSTVPRYKARK